MNAVHKRSPRARRSMFAELDSLVQEELDAVLTGRDEPSRKQAQKPDPPVTIHGSSTAADEIESQPENAGTAFPAGNEADGSGADLQSLFDAEDLAAIERIAVELRDRPNAEWMLEAVHERLFAGRAEDHANAGAAPVTEAS